MARLEEVSTSEQIHHLLLQPAGKPPPGVVPNFQNHPTLDWAVILTVTFSVMIATISFLMRIYTKAFIIKCIAYEDYAVVVGWVILFADNIGYLFVSSHGGQGTHIWNVRLETLYGLLRWFNVAAIIYTPAEFFIRLSILLQYLRLFVPSRQGHSIMFYATHILIWSNLIFHVAKLIGLCAICTPRRKLWQPWISGGHCSNMADWFIACGVFNIVVDFAILILPLRCIWKLQLPTKRKIMMAMVFAIGLLACIASIFRTYYSFLLKYRADVTYNAIIVGLGAMLELGFGVVVACTPVLPRFFFHFKPRFMKILTCGPHGGIWNCFSNFSTRLKSLLGRRSASKQHDTWMGSTKFGSQHGPEAIEQRQERKEIVIDIPDAILPLEQTLATKSLPPTPRLPIEEVRTGKIPHLTSIES